jgi:hypothetical protein
MRRAGDGDAELTSVVDDAGAQWWGRYCSDGSGRTLGARWCSVTCNRKGEMVSHAFHGGRGNRKQGWQRSAYRSGQEVKGRDNMQGGGLFL